MYLSSEEKETHITHSPSDNNEVWTLYTTEGKMMRKIERLGIKPFDIEYDSDGDIVAKHYHIPFKQILFVRERKKPIISEERRRELQENAAKMLAMKKAKRNIE